MKEYTVTYKGTMTIKAKSKSEAQTKAWLSKNLDVAFISDFVIKEIE